jgi:hypothetical protein
MNANDVWVPIRIAVAAKMIEDWADEQHVKSWELMGLCSRNHACAAEELATAIQVGLDHGYGLRIGDTALANYRKMKGLT